MWRMLLLVALLAVGCAGTNRSGRALIAVQTIWAQHRAFDQVAAAQYARICPNGPREALECEEGDAACQTRRAALPTREQCRAERRQLNEIPVRVGDGSALRSVSLRQVVRAHRSLSAAAIGAVVTIDAMQEDDPDATPTQETLHDISCGWAIFTEVTRILNHLGVQVPPGWATALTLFQNYGQVARTFILGSCSGWDEMRSTDPPPQTGQEPNPGGSSLPVSLAPTGVWPTLGVGSGPAWARVESGWQLELLQPEVLR